MNLLVPWNWTPAKWPKSSPTSSKKTRFSRLIPRSLTTASFSLRKASAVTWFVSLKKENRRAKTLETIQKHITTVEQELGIEYDSIQKQAICDAIQNKVFILTGGPGTGKTTVINGIIGVYALLERLDLRKKSSLPILLAAPTGRAARRMNELTGLPSATIHRHLGMTGDDDTSHLEDYLDADFIIVDEFSMVDTWLANQLFSNISSTSKILIVGDSDQLPSVSPGQVLADLLQIPKYSANTLGNEFIVRAKNQPSSHLRVRFVREFYLQISLRKRQTVPTLKSLVTRSQRPLKNPRRCHQKWHPCSRYPSSSSYVSWCSRNRCHQSTHARTAQSSSKGTD